MTDDPTRREFMAAGVSAAALSLLPNGQPLDRDAWPTDAEINPPSDSELETKQLEEFESHGLTRLNSERVEVEITSGYYDDGDSLILVGYDYTGVYIDFQIEYGKDRGGIRSIVPPEAVEELAARIESTNPMWHYENGELADEITPNHSYGSFGTAVIESDLGIGDVPSGVHLREYADGMYLLAEIREETVTHKVEIAIDEPAELARTLRIAAAEWRAWPATEGE